MTTLKSEEKMKIFKEKSKKKQFGGELENQNKAQRYFKAGNNKPKKSGRANLNRNLLSFSLSHSLSHL